MVTAEGIFPKIGNDPIYASEVNSFNNKGWIKTNYSGVAGYSLLDFGSGVWVKISGTSSVRSTNYGVTWTACTSDDANMIDAVVCVADPTKAFAWKNDTNDGATTSDSGDNWTARSNFANGNTKIASFPTSTVVVIGIDQGADTRTIFYSADSGATFTMCTSGPTVSVSGITMFNATHGFAAANSVVYYTTDGGDNWTSTGHNLTSSNTNPDAEKMLAISTTEYIFCNQTGAWTTGDNTSAAEILINSGGITPNATNFDDVSNIVQMTNGSYYAIGTETGTKATFLMRVDALTANAGAYFYNLADVDFVTGTFNNTSLLAETSTNNLTIALRQTFLTMVDYR